MFGKARVSAQASQGDQPLVPDPRGAIGRVETGAAAAPTGEKRLGIADHIFCASRISLLQQTNLRQSALPHPFGYPTQPKGKMEG
jgi:hypothetical protein